MFLRTFSIAGVASLLIASAGPAAPARAGADLLAPDDAPVAIQLTGVIRDAATGAALQGAQLEAFIGRAQAGALSEVDGRYLFNFIDAAAGREVAVVVQLIGYETQRKTVKLEGPVTTLDFELEATALALQALVASAARGEARDAAAQAAVRENLPANARIQTRGPGQDRLRRYQELVERGGIELDREAYAHIDENEFIAVDQQPLSTFSIDVDRASYANVRRFLNDGMRPPIDAVRIEELINYFPYGDPAPDAGDPDPVWITTEVAPAPWQPLHRLARIGVRARSIDMADAPPSNLVFLIDVSGSMRSPSKLPLLKHSFAMLVEQLRPEDRVAIVVYAGAAGLVLPSTPGSDRGTILQAIERLEAGGSTAGGAGIRLAYAVAREHHIDGGNNRVILATDGDFNVGQSSDAEMIHLIEEKREQGTFLTVLGFGTGNLQDAKMEQIANHGNGNYAYIDGALEARKVLVSEMGGTLLTVAKDVKIQVEFNPAQVASYRLIGYENRLLAAEDFNDDTKDAGEMGAGHTVTALYEIVPVGVESPVTARSVDPLRYQRNRTTEAVADNGELMFVKLRYKDPEGTESKLVTRRVEETTVETTHDFRFSAAVAAWGMLLRDSEHCEDFTLDDVARLARGALGADEGGYRGEFLGLVDRARAMDLLAMEAGARR